MSASLRALSGLALALVLVLAPKAAASSLDDVGDQWLPRSDGAQWTYEWTDNQFSPAKRVERYASRAQRTAFRVQWSQARTGGVRRSVQRRHGLQPDRRGAGQRQLPEHGAAAAVPDPVRGSRRLRQQPGGRLYLLIWGTRSPVLAEPLLTGTRWNTVGGAGDDVASRNRYVGRAKVSVPAFPAPLDAAMVESSVTQTGALGDPYGSGSRTVWWVRGVGPVRIVFRHSGGQVSEAVLRSTTLVPKPPPPDTNLLPLNRGDTMTLRWRNDRHMQAWSTQRLTVADVVNNTSRVDVKQVSARSRSRAATRSRRGWTACATSPRRSRQRPAPSSPRWARARNRRMSGGGS